MIAERRCSKTGLALAGVMLALAATTAQAQVPLIDQVRAQWQRDHPNETIVPKTELHSPTSKTDQPPAVYLARVKRLANVIPPVEFDHPFAGLVIVQRLKDEATMAKVCNPGDGHYIGCAHHLKDACLVMLVDEAVMRSYAIGGDMVLRHELGHCNGWPAKHAGARTYWNLDVMPKRAVTAEEQAAARASSSYTIYPTQ